jgi:hypothetical protein
MTARGDCPRDFGQHQSWGANPYLIRAKQTERLVDVRGVQVYHLDPGRLPHFTVAGLRTDAFTAPGTA